MDHSIATRPPAQERWAGRGASGRPKKGLRKRLSVTPGKAASPQRIDAPARERRPGCPNRVAARRRGGPARKPRPLPAPPWARATATVDFPARPAFPLHRRTARSRSVRGWRQGRPCRAIAPVPVGVRRTGGQPARRPGVPASRARSAVARAGTRPGTHPMTDFARVQAYYLRPSPTRPPVHSKRRGAHCPLRAPHPTAGRSGRRGDRAARRGSRSGGKTWRRRCG